MSRIQGARDLDGARGCEGFCAREYFKAFRQFLNNDMGFEGRNYHPPVDPINALLSLGYTLLFNRVLGAVNIVGLDPYQGFLHSSMHGNAALVSDLMEEWRTIVVDSMVIAMINRKEIKEEDFETRGDSGKIFLSSGGLKKFLSRFDDGMNRQVHHPLEGKKFFYRQCIEIQARRFADVILGKEKIYAPFLSR